MKLSKSRSLGISSLIFLGLLVAGCGGGGSSSSGGGGASVGGANKSVQGNVSSVDDGLAINMENGVGAGFENLIAYTLTKFVSPTFAGSVEGIEVCIEGRCTFTDTSGAFSLDLTGVPAGIYAISFSVGISIYTAEIDVMDDALVELQNISISGDGLVRINNIRVVLLDTDIDVDIDIDTDDPIDEPVDDDGAKPNSVSLCHKPGTPAEKTLVLPETASKGHLGHGDTLGACEPSTISA